MNNSNDIAITELKLAVDPFKMLKEESIDLKTINEPNYDVINKDNDMSNNIIFFGYSKDNMIINYNMKDDKWSRLEYFYADKFKFLDFSASAAFSNSQILITGGCLYTNYRDTASNLTFLFKNIENQLTISLYKPMLINRFSHGCLIIKNTPYVFGGHNGEDSLSSMEYYDEYEDKWKFLSSMNIDREIFGYCCLKDRYIYVFGGFNSNNMDSIERYDIIYDSWKLLSYKMKRSLQKVTALSIDDSRIALIGGYNGAFHKCIDVLDVKTKIWTSLEYLRIPRRRSHVYKNKNKVEIIYY